MTPRPVTTGRAPEGYRLVPVEDIKKLHNAISFFGSCIKSGERWTERCQEIYLGSRAILNAAAPSPSTPVVGEEKILENHVALTAEQSRENLSSTEGEK